MIFFKKMKKPNVVTAGSAQSHTGAEEKVLSCHMDSVGDVVDQSNKMDVEDQDSSGGSENGEGEELYERLDPKKNGVLHVIDNVPKHLYEMRNLWDFIENELALAPPQYLIGKFLDKGGIHLWIHEDSRLGEMVQTLGEGVLIKEVRNKKLEASKSVLVFGVPLHFPVQNFTDVGYNIKEAIRWNPPKGKVRRTSIVELVFNTAAEAKCVLRNRKIALEGILYNIEPKFLSKARVCRNCKKINPDHSPYQCTTIRCGKCSGKHSTKEHENLMNEEEKEKILCPACAGKHIFIHCPSRAKEVKRSMKDQQRSYKDALTKRDRREYERPVQSKPEKKGTSVEDLLAKPEENLALLLELFQKLTALFANGNLLSLLQKSQGQAPVAAPTVQFVEEPKSIPKRPKISPEQNEEGLFVCSKNCGILPSKTAGPMSKHILTCSGEDYQKQLKNKSTASRSIRVEAILQKSAPKSVTAFFKKTPDSTQ